jgi:signal transduction histidine kinase
MLPRLVEQSNKSMRKVSALIEDLLNLSRMNEGHLKLRHSTFAVGQLLHTCCPHVREAGVYELIVDSAEPLEVYADEQMIDQVLVNLINNAAKYAAGSKQIHLTARKQGGMARISVKDHGPGIPKDKQVRLFDRYYQVHSEGFQNSGLGLGLYICKQIIKKHGGHIGVESEEGRGSEFWFTLPLAD